jgi:hypothetical protein
MFYLVRVRSATLSQPWWTVFEGDRGLVVVLVTLEDILDRQCLTVAKTLLRRELGRTARVGDLATLVG